MFFFLLAVVVNFFKNIRKFLLTKYFLIKNDEALIKMSAIVQRAMNASGEGEDSLGISEAEKQALLDTLDSMEKNKK